MLRQIKPRNKRAQRALEKRGAKVIENPKHKLFLRGTACSQIVQNVLGDLFSLAQPLAKKFSKKNTIHPFQDVSSLEFFSEKNDCSILVFGSSNKKRPHTITLARTFGHKVLDMLELNLDATKYRPLGDFDTEKMAVGLRPLVIFAGTSFESPVENEWTMAKSMLVDLFKGETAEKIDVEGLKYVVCVSVDEPMETSGGDDPSAKQVLHVRYYLIRTKRSGQRLPRVEVEEMGPRLDFRVGRVRRADVDMLKEAMRQAKTTEERTKKNITTNSMGDKIGRIHVGKQDVSQMQTRKMKGLKRGRDVEDVDDHEGSSDEELRRKRKA